MFPEWVMDPNATVLSMSCTVATWGVSAPIPGRPRLTW